MAARVAGKMSLAVDVLTDGLNLLDGQDYAQHAALNLVMAELSHPLIYSALHGMGHFKVRNPMALVLKYDPGSGLEIRPRPTLCSHDPLLRVLTPPECL